MLPGNRVSVEISLFGRMQKIRLGREILLDEDGKQMPKFYTEKEKQEHIEQYNRLAAMMGDERLHDYMKYKMGIHSENREKLRNGEAWLGDYFDEEIFEGLGIGSGWILHGDENCKEYPCGPQVKNYLDKHPERREQIWKWMQEDGFEVEDCFHDYDYEEENWDDDDGWDDEDELEEFEEYEDFEDDWDDD